MNSENVLSRIKYLIQADTMNATVTDFLATHVPFDSLIVSDRYETLNEKTNRESEKSVYDLVLNDESDQSQFVVVLGESGSGKSHLIRWMGLELEREDREDEVVLLIRRDNNTLMSTLKQLLANDYVKGLIDPDTVNRLGDVTEIKDESYSKDALLYKYALLVEHDADFKALVGNEIGIPKEKLVDLLRNRAFATRLLEMNGPIDRIYCKIMGEPNAELEEKGAKFLPEEFLIPAEVVGEIREESRSLRRIVNKLADHEETGLQDEETIKICKAIADYLNTKTEEVIRSTFDLGRIDIRELFKDIRRKLKENGKTLTLLIEDITGWDGVNAELLEVLISKSDGAYSDLCKMTSIVGITEAYFQENFKVNHRDRVAKYIKLSGEMFATSGSGLDRLCEFFGRYINALMLPASDFEEWYDNGAESIHLPVYKEECEWKETVKLDNGMELPIYPFNKRAILNIYAEKRYELTTPRKILKDLISPVVERVVTNPGSFPDVNHQLIVLRGNKDADTCLRELFYSKIYDKDQYDRVSLLINTWGSAPFEKNLVNGQELFAGIQSQFFEQVNLQFPNGEAKEISQKERELLIHKLDVNSAEKTVQSNDQIEQKYQEIPLERLNEYDEFVQVLEKWKNGDPIRDRSNVGVQGKIKKIRETLSMYLYDTINWLEYDVSRNHLNLLKNKKELIKFEDGLFNKGKFILKRDDVRTYEMLKGLGRSVIYQMSAKARHEFDYENGLQDLSYLLEWCEINKDEFVKSITEIDGEKTNFEDYALAIDYYRYIISSSSSEKGTSLKNIKFDSYYRDQKFSYTTKNRTRQWEDMIAHLFYDEKNKLPGKYSSLEPRRIVMSHYNQTIGINESKKYLIDEPKLENQFNRVKKMNFFFDQLGERKVDEIGKRDQYYDLLDEVIRLINEGVRAERTELDEYEMKLNAYLGSSSVPAAQLNDLFGEIDSFYSKVDLLASSLHISCTKPGSFEMVRKKANRFCEMMTLMQKIKNTNNTLDQLALLSKNPGNEIRILVDMLDEVSKHMEAVKERIKDDERLSNEIEETKENSYHNELKKRIREAGVFEEGQNATK